MEKVIGGIILLMLALTIIIVDADPAVRWIRPSDSPSYLLVGEEFEVVLEKLDSEISNLRPTRMRIVVGEAIEEPFIVVRFLNGSQEWIRDLRALDVSVSLFSPPQSIRLVGVIPTRFDQQEVRLIAIYFLHGDTLLAEFSLTKQAFSNVSADLYENKEKLRLLEYVVLALIIVVVVVAFVVVALLKGKGKEGFTPLNPNGRR
jgi:hypothetical protein